MRPHLCDAFLIFYGMDKTSMSNSTKNRLNKKGFTLAEVLVTVAIIIILAGVTFVSVAQYQKNLRLMEMDGTAKEIFIAAQNHLSVAKASGDLDRLAEKANATGTTGSPIGTSLTSAPSYAGNDRGNYYYVIHNVTSGRESCTPSGSDAILEMMLPFGALDETVSVSGNYAIVYELKSASVVAVLYSGAGNASFGNAAVINFGDEDVANINNIYNDKSARKNYKKADVTAIVGCYTGTAGSAALPTETLEAPKLEVKNENKLHVLVREANNTDNITLVITGEQSGTTARRLLDRNTGDGYTKTSGTFDVTLDDITGGDGAFRFCQLIKGGRFTPDVAGSDFIPGENIIISAIASSTTALATPKESAKYTVSSLFDDVNETTNSNGDTKVYIKNLRHLENLGANVSGFTAALRKDATSGHYNVVNITAVQKNDITMFSFDGLCDGQYIYGSGTFASTYIAANVDYPLCYDGGSHEIYDLTIAGYHKDNVEANAGIFGTVTNTLSVKNLVLRNDKIPKTSTSANAGMILGKTSADLTVDGVLAYYHETEYNEANDSAVEVQAEQVAGGLIGLVSSGTLNVKNSAAAVYVKGGSAAGGLIGSVSDAANGSIVQSYAGGHTMDGAYSTTDATTNRPVLDGSGRYNVQATQASGYAGGFIGVTTNNVKMNAVYSTASAYASSGDANSNSFAGNGVPNIQPTADGKKNYYAIGPHNGTDASAEDTAKSEIHTGQVRRQATPYDRKLILMDSETEHKTMDKTSYPLCTVRNLCEGNTSVKDTDLPWFIKEHVGDWVVHKENGKAGFEIENGNRLLVNVDTGIEKIQDDTYYELKVHGNSSNQDAYFLIYVNKNNSVTVRRSVNEAKVYEWNPVVSEVCTLKTSKNNGSKSLILEFCLDDITKNGGNFLNVCTNSLWPGEDITLNVAPAKCIHIQNQNPYWVAEFDAKNEQLTNSIYGSSVPSSLNKNDEHNNRKIDAVHNVNTTLDMKDNSWGLIPGAIDGGLYAQIDNSRHLQNLTSEVSGEKSGFKIKITGAIQTDNIYWTGDILNKDAFTMSIQEELHPENSSDIVIWGNGRQLTTDSCFKPFAYFDGLKYYNGSDFKISGLKVNETGDAVAGLFAQRGNELTIINLTMENALITSQNSRAGVLIGYAQGKTVIDNVHITGKTTVQGKAESGGLIGRLENEAQITNSNIEKITVISKEINGNDGNHAGGLVGYAKNSSFTIRNVSVASQNTEVIAAKNAGGLIGYMEGCGSLTLDTVNVTAFVTSDSTDNQGGAGGFFGYIAGLGAKPVIKDCHYYGADIKEQKNSLTQELYTANINAKKSAGGIIGYAACDVELAGMTQESAIIASSEGYAGGLVGSSGSVTIKVNDKDNQSNKENDSVKLYKMIVVGHEAAGGIIGNAGKDAVIKNVDLEQVKITSGVSYAGGLIGNVEQYIPITIDQITLDQCEITGSQATGGFIGRVSNATVTIENSNVNNIKAKTIESKYVPVGGLIGYTNQHTDITNVHITDSSIAGDSFTGGFIGQFAQPNNPNDKITILNSSIRRGTISSEDRVGGFIGLSGGKVDFKNDKADEILIASGNNAGGILGEAQDNTVLVNVKVIGRNTEIYGNGDTGGLIGWFAGGDWKHTLQIENSMASAFVKSTGENAGGLVGRVTKPDTYADSHIYNSFYGGRTKNGVYGINVVPEGASSNQRYYDANVIGKYSAGGLIGNIETKVFTFTVANSYSTGSVMAENAAGGLIGQAGDITLNISQCYSIGRVMVSANTMGWTGGLIGYHAGLDQGGKIENTYYLNSFNDASVKAVGNDMSSKYEYATMGSDTIILGNSINSDISTVTHNYDETLNGQAYPYKNWMTDWEVDGATATTPIAYYGDWPLLQLNGSFVYFDAIDKNKNKYEKGGSFNIYSYEKNMNTILTPYETKLKPSGFGIISDVNNYDELANYYQWSYKIDANENEKLPCKIEGNGIKDGEHKGEVSKYSKFSYLGKEFYFYRCTFDGLENLKDDTIFVWAEKGPNKGAVYKVDIHDNKVSFELHSNPNSTLNP